MANLHFHLLAVLLAGADGHFSQRRSNSIHGSTGTAQAQAAISEPSVINELTHGGVGIPPTPDLSTGKSNQITITNERDHLSQSQTDPIVQETGKFCAHDEDNKAKVEDPCQSEASQATGVPHHEPRFIKFRDQDSGKGLIRGTVRLGHAYCEDDILWYSLHWARNGTKIMPPIQTLGKTGGDVHFEIHGQGSNSAALEVPSDVNQLMVVSGNHHGAMTEGPVVDIFDHVGIPVRSILRNILRGGF